VEEDDVEEMEMEMEEEYGMEVEESMKI